MNRVVLITGASSGIGRSCAIMYAKNNYDLVVTYNNNYKGINDLKKYIEENYNVKIITYKLDISNEDNISKVVSDTIFEFGRIDVLINNAGIAIDTTYDDKTKDNFMKILEVNTVGTFLMCKYVAKYMLEQRFGNIINISSTNGIDTNYIESLDYDVSKAGVISLSKNLACEYAPFIRVNTVCPGWVETDMNKYLDKEFKDREIDKILLKRFGNPEEIAKVIYFISSDDASYVNNAIIRVDGGY